MSAANLGTRQCKPCAGEVKPFSKEEAEAYLKQVPDWKLKVEGKLIYREYTLKNFMEGVRFIEEIAKIAQKEGHHPDLHLTAYRKLKIELATHAIGGLSENDFIMAAKIDKIPVALKK